MESTVYRMKVLDTLHEAQMYLIDQLKNQPANNRADLVNAITMLVNAQGVVIMECVRWN